ncbi:MAG: cardiolipin synthase [Acholeplasmataceae bacterium]|nr:cardiolipin synthase [Acholeplasmataceae bacterium]
MKKFLKLLFSRVTVIGILILLQLIAFAFMVYLSISIDYTWGFYIAIGLEIFSILVAIYILGKDMHPTYKIAWVAPILMVPIFGGLFYILYSQRNYGKKTVIKANKLVEIRKDLTQELLLTDTIGASKILATNYYPTFKDSKIDFIKTGKETFENIIEDLKKAKNFILVQFFIVKKGKLFNEFMEILDQKVQEGVEVFFLYDDFGSNGLPMYFYKKLRKKGYRATTFNKVRPHINFAMNYRNHRKLVIIDGIIGYTGGINLADEYIGMEERFGYWLDDGLKVEGNAVWSFTISFFEDWELQTKEKIDRLFYKVDQESFNLNNSITPYADVSINNQLNAKNILLHMISNAEKYVYVSSPYLIIDYELENAFSQAAKRGIDVRILIPEIPDKKLIYMVSLSYAKDLAKNNVKIYKYTPGFNHAKALLVDGQAANVGTTNFDYRSFFLHFENNVYFEDDKAIIQLKDFFIKAFEESKLNSYEDLRNKSFIYRTIQNFFKAFSTLL